MSELKKGGPDKGLHKLNNKIHVLTLQYSQCALSLLQHHIVFPLVAPEQLLDVRMIFPLINENVVIVFSIGHYARYAMIMRPFSKWGPWLFCLLVQWQADRALQRRAPSWVVEMKPCAMHQEIQLPPGKSFFFPPKTVNGSQTRRVSSEPLAGKRSLFISPFEDHWLRW